jgi:tetratricopeptide (TPR) repeat protein
MDEQKRALLLKDIEYFSKKLEEDPKSKVFMPLALAYLKLGKYDDVIEICTKGLDHNPDYFAAKTILAEAYIGKGMVNEAKGLLLEVVTILKDNYKANKLLGEIYRAEGKIDKAIYYYRNAAQSAPEDFELRELIQELAIKTDATPYSIEEEGEKADEDRGFDTEIDEKTQDITTLTEHLADEVMKDFSQIEDTAAETEQSKTFETEDEEEGVTEVVIPEEENLNEEIDFSALDEFDTSRDIGEELEEAFSKAFSKEGEEEELSVFEEPEKAEPEKAGEETARGTTEVTIVETTKETTVETTEVTVKETTEETVEESINESIEEALRDEAANSEEEDVAQAVFESTEPEKPVDAKVKDENAELVEKLEEWLKNIQKIKMNRDV